MAATKTPWTVERHDQEDGSINYEIWSIHPPETYHRIATINDFDNENAKDDAELIVRSVNARFGH